MKKMIAGLGLSGAALIGLGGAADAAYPPESPGTLTVHDAVCTYTDDTFGEVASWSVTIDYTVTAENAYLLIINPFVDDIIASIDAPIGTHSETVTNETPGTGGDMPVNGSIDVQLGAGDDIVTATSAGCPIASSERPDGGSGTKISGPTGKTTGTTGSTKSTKSNLTALPETGVDATSAALGALALLGAGYTLVWAARREDAEAG